MTFMFCIKDRVNCLNFGINDNLANSKGFLLPNATSKLISNALMVDLGDSYGEKNKTGYVSIDSTKSMPSDCIHGLREVFFYNPQSVILKITGIDTNSITTSWVNRYNGNAWSGWQRQPTNIDLKQMFQYNNFFGNISANDDIELYAQGVAVKNTLSKILDLHIQARIANNGNESSNGSSFAFIDLSKIKTAIGVNTIEFNDRQATLNVSFKQDSIPAYDGGIDGYTGIGISKNGNYIQLTRIYQSSGSVGAWPIDTVRGYLKKGIIYHIDIYGASYT